MRTGIYGGTFSPPHKGHYAAAKRFFEAAGLDRLLVMPSLISPHKPTAKDDDPRKRVEMLDIMFKDDPGISVCDYEIKKGGVSYTYLTLEHFREEGDTLCMLVGSDMFLSLDSWREPERIFNAAEIWCVSRTGTDGAELDEKKRCYEQKYGARCFICESEAIDVSSTEVRQLLRRGEDADAYLLPGVAEYIKENDLYGAKNRYIKEYIKGHLSKKRYDHSTGVASTAEDIGERLGLPESDISDLIRAGLCHDVSKELTAAAQLDLLEEAGVDVDLDYIKAPVTLHQLSGAVLAKKLFGVSDRIAGMIKYHCTGAPGMSLCEKIVFLSDFIEPGREYEACRAMREEFYSAPVTEEHIDRTFLICCKRQYEHIQEKGGTAHGLTRLTYFTEVNKMAENEIKKDLKDGSSSEIAEYVRAVLDEKLAKHIETIPVREKTVMTDYFVIANATSTTHVKALADEVEYKLGEAGLRPLHIDGQPGGDWYVLDYGAVIVHIFVGAAREFYKIDRLWQDKAPMEVSGDAEK